MIQKKKFSYQPSNKTLNCIFQIQAMRICQAIKKGNLRGQCGISNTIQNETPLPLFNDTTELIAIFR